MADAICGAEGKVLMSTRRTIRRRALPRVSKLEAEFDLLVRVNRWPVPEREYRFMPNRRFRFDRAWPSIKLAVELEGGIWIRGRHTRPAGYEADCEKYNLAVCNGWRVLRFTGKMLKDGRAERTMQWLLS
jgi:very-short-patch-repair endonuclease